MKWFESISSNMNDGQENIFPATNSNMNMNHEQDEDEIEEQISEKTHTPLRDHILHEV